MAVYAYRQLLPFALALPCTKGTMQKNRLRMNMEWHMCWMFALIIGLRFPPNTSNVHHDRFLVAVQSRIHRSSCFFSQFTSFSLGGSGETDHVETISVPRMQFCIAQEKLERLFYRPIHFKNACLQTLS